ncbi:MAG TPA: hypothetical protein VGN36_02645 [Sphingorhabdus sp.]|nr:hypothetical protein [Sphingorhabdus sp.]
MRFKVFLFALPLLAATPVAAQDVVYVSGTGEPVEDAYYAPDDSAESDNSAAMEEIADRIDDPATRYGVAAAVEGVTGAIMNMPIGGLTDAIERARPGTVDRRLPRDARLGDLAGASADRLPQKMGARSLEAMEMMGGFARVMAAMMPEFERMGREMEESFRAAKAEAKRNRY